MSSTGQYSENLESALTYADLLLTEPVSPPPYSASGLAAENVGGNCSFQTGGNPKSSNYHVENNFVYLHLQRQNDRQSNFAWSSQEPQVTFKEKPLLGVRIPYECTDSQKRSTDTENGPTPGPSSARPNSSGTQKPKRVRTAYSAHQIVRLEKEFCTDKYLCRRRRIEMAVELNMTERQVKVWFQNRRLKFKKEEEQRASSPSSTNSQTKSRIQTVRPKHHSVTKRQVGHDICMTEAIPKNQSEDNASCIQHQSSQNTLDYHPVQFRQNKPWYQLYLNTDWADAYLFNIHVDASNSLPSL
ncbi:unnamed protein product [Acanthoscelides obtectus]|uniref:Homeobox domain-containing protein n=1 Tax=Acanthoscelides obtectus TaxID=200917 RepID=A0A9P0NTR8_ACAOB|nr:unnamed protein product [Acanthoscelides obtectus]CAK1654364.1 Homeobox protein Hox-A3 [Acanthoscelides obtectus]